MKKHQLAAIISALVMSAGLPALAADHGVRNIQVAPGADSPGGSADTTAAPNSAAPDQTPAADSKKDEATSRTAKKHPPTNRMDSATSPGKSDSSDANASGKQGQSPTKSMDSASPTQRSPGTSPSGSTDATSDQQSK